MLLVYIGQFKVSYSAIANNPSLRVYTMKAKYRASLVPLASLIIGASAAVIEDVSQLSKTTYDFIIVGGRSVYYLCKF